MLVLHEEQQELLLPYSTSPCSAHMMAAHLLLPYIYKCHPGGSKGRTNLTTLIVKVALFLQQEKHWSTSVLLSKQHIQHWSIQQGQQGQRRV
jgi:hypothetical protein